MCKSKVAYLKKRWDFDDWEKKKSICCCFIDAPNAVWQFSFLSCCCPYFHQSPDPVITRVEFLLCCFSCEWEWVQWYILTWSSLRSHPHHILLFSYPHNYSSKLCCPIVIFLNWVNSTLPSPLGREVSCSIPAVSFCHRNFNMIFLSFYFRSQRSYVQILLNPLSLSIFHHLVQITALYRKK